MARLREEQHLGTEEHRLGSLTQTDLRQELGKRLAHGSSETLVAADRRVAEN
jgi:hypothetical protein